MRILGIDPGLNTTGYGVIDITRAGAGVIGGRRTRLLEAGVVRSRGDTLAIKVREIYDGIREVLVEWSPEAVAIEQLFARYDRPDSAILMGHARGVICLAVAQQGLTVATYSPAQVKKRLTGSGKATKDQVQRAVALELGLTAPPHPPDVADALAIALSHVVITESLGSVRRA